MAIVRMVNGISDKAQKGKTATSVSSNAAAAGNYCYYVSSNCINVIDVSCCTATKDAGCASPASCSAERTLCI